MTGLSKNGCFVRWEPARILKVTASHSGMLAPALTVATFRPDGECKEWMAVCTELGVVDTVDGTECEALDRLARSMAHRIGDLWLREEASASEVGVETDGGDPKALDGMFAARRVVPAVVPSDTGPAAVEAWRRFCVAVWDTAGLDFEYDEDAHRVAFLVRLSVYLERAVSASMSKECAL